MQCPYITNPNKIDRTFNELVKYKEYIYFKHTTLDGEITNVQFCELCGRKKDIFECFNENEWKDCAYYLLKELPDEKKKETL